MTARALHLSPALIALVGIGGAVGTGARYALTTAIAPAGNGWPTATFVENLVGAFALGVLLDLLVRRGAESRAARRARLALGTGMLGGFTTFSTLAMEVERLATAGEVGIGVAYGLTSVTLGFVLALFGVLVGARLHDWRQERLPVHADQAGVLRRVGESDAEDGER